MLYSGIEFYILNKEFDITRRVKLNIVIAECFPLHFFITTYLVVFFCFLTPLFFFVKKKISVSKSNSQSESCDYTRKLT